jgi:tetratricopeptide (TPR) repeat protein
MKNHFLKSLTFWVLSFLILVFILEVFFRNFEPKRIVPDFHQSQYNLPNVLRSNLDITLDWLHGYLYPPFRLQTNSKHFLNHQEFRYEKPKGTFRVLTVGNSIFMGLGVEIDELFSKNLENILNERSTQKRIEVINFSGVAWSTIEFLEFLKTEGYKYQPDLVIISQGENDFRVQYNNLIQINKIDKENLVDGNIKINLSGMEINPQGNGLVSTWWEWIRKLPFYVKISQHSQALYQVRFKLNALMDKGISIVPKSKQFGYFLESNNIQLTKDIVLSLNSDDFSVQPEDHSITSFAKNYNHNAFEANANIALHSAVQVKISQFLSSLNASFVVLDIPARSETLGSIDPNRTRDINSNLKNYYFLNPLKELKNFQSKNLTAPLYFYDNNHLTPSGNRLLAVLVYNFLAQTRLLPSQNDWNLIDLKSPKITNSIEKANNRIDEFIKTSDLSYKFQGTFYKLRGNYNLAHKNLIEYLKKEKNDFETHYLLGIVLVKLNKLSLALESFKKSFGGHPLEVKKYKYAYKFTKFYKEGWDNYNNGNLVKALYFAKELEKLNGEWWGQGFGVFLNYSIHYKLRDLPRADHYVNQGLKLKPNEFKWKLINASLKFEQKNYESAKEYAFQVLKLKKNEPKALLILGVSLTKVGDKNEARKILSKFLKLNPNNGFAKQALLDLEEK